ncbi:Cap-specific mRNA (nucleoside-2'-O-)-methyltransferase 1 [Varanus komodoensis]|nr:Cap-specific mRNA (nucleoside-2'-O-)-methyltransferase 1 [Varanus komodoensis]
MKRRAEPEYSSPQKRQKKRIEELGLTLSSTSDDETQLSNHATQESSTTSSSESDSESNERRPVLGSFSNKLRADSLVEGTSSRYSMYNSVSQKLMAKMGFREGEGLGKYGQGRQEIVEASQQKGRRGLGLTLKGFDGEVNINWQDEPEASAYEQVDWFPECTTEIPDAEEMKDWLTIGKAADIPCLLASLLLLVAAAVQLFLAPSKSALEGPQHSGIECF